MINSTNIPIVYSSPFETNSIENTIPIGTSIVDVLNILGMSNHKRGLRVFVNDVFISPSQYHSTYPLPGDKVFVGIAMFGGGEGDSNKSIRTIAILAVMVVAVAVSYGAAAPALGGAFAAGTFGASAAGLAIGMVGALAIMSFIPPATPDQVTSGGTSVQERFGITGSSNRYLPFENVPKTLGLDRVYPPYAAKPYTKIIGQDQFIYMIFSLGRGPLEGSDEKFGDTLCSSYTTAIEYGTGNNLPAWFSDGNISQEVKSLLLGEETFPDPQGSPVPGAYTQITTEECTEIGLDFYSPILVYVKPDTGVIYKIGVEITIEWTKSGGSYWYNITDDPSYYDLVISSGGSIDATYRSIAFFGARGDARRMSVSFSPYGSSRNKFAYDVRIRRVWTYREYWPWVTVDDGGYITKRVQVLQKATTIPTSDGCQSDVTLVGVQSINKYEVPIDVDDDLYFVSVRAKATNELNGVPDNFNLMVQAHHPVYSGGQYTYQATSLPPWIYADLITGSANHRAISRINLETDDLVAWASTCTTEGYEFNATISNTSLSEIRRLVCAAGRAVPHQIGNKHTIIFDGEQTTIHQVFSPRNSWGFKFSKAFPERPQALRVAFKNKDKEYQPDERIVPDDGYTESTATTFESIQYQGINDPEMIYKMGRWDFAQSKLRPELFELNVDIEYLVAGRGKLVAVASDVPLWGSGWCRIASVELGPLDGGTQDVTLTVDDVCTFLDGTNYAILIRPSTVDPISVSVDNPGAGETNVLTCTLAAASAAAIVKGDLLLFGVAQSHYHKLIIKSIFPMGDVSAKLLLVEYNPDIYDNETVYGTIPDFDSDITAPVDRTKLPPPIPTIDLITSDETVMVLNMDGTWTVCMAVSYKFTSSGSTIPAVSIECQYRLYDSGNDTMAWVIFPPQPPDGGSISVYSLQQGKKYEVRIRSKSSYGVFSSWATTTHIVLGNTAPPPQVTGFIYAFDDAEAKLSWDMTPVWDRKDYELRYGTVASTWETATLIGSTANTTKSIPAQWAGTRYFFIKARDTSGFLSVTATSINVQIIAPSITEIIADVVDNNVLLKWTNVKGSLPISHTELRRGTTFSGATVIGEKKGTFTSVFEMVSAQYKYWLVAVDIAGNYGTEQSITVTVNEPPDFTITEHWREDFDDLDSTTNVLVLSDGTAIAPFDTTETLADYFTDNSFTCEQDAINAGYLYVAEPVPTSAECYQEFNVGAVVGSSTATLDLDTTPFNGGATISEYLAEKELVGDSYSETSDNPAQWNNFQYVRDRFAFVSDGTEFDVLNIHSVRLDSKTRRDHGTDEVTVASTGKTVSFNKTFALVQSVVATSNDSSSVYFAIVDFDGSTANPTTFIVYLYNTSGTKVTGDFYWEAIGV